MFEDFREYDKDVFNYCPTCGTRETRNLEDYTMEMVDSNMIRVPVTCTNCSRTWSMWFRYENTST